MARAVDAAPPALWKPDGQPPFPYAYLQVLAKAGASVSAKGARTWPTPPAARAGMRNLLDTLFWDARNRGATGVRLEYRPELGTLCHLAQIDVGEVTYQADGWFWEVAITRAWLWAFNREALETQEAATNRPPPPLERTGLSDPSWGEKLTALTKEAGAMLADHGLTVVETNLTAAEQLELYILSGRLPHQEWVERSCPIMGIPVPTHPPLPLWTQMQTAYSKRH